MKLSLSAILLVVFSTTIQARVNCAQFADQSEAQQYYEDQRHGYRSLDRDHDGEACECLPGGSAYGKSVCRRWRKKYGK